MHGNPKAHIPPETTFLNVIYRDVHDVKHTSSTHTGKVFWRSPHPSKADLVSAIGWRRFVAWWALQGSDVGQGRIRICIAVAKRKNDNQESNLVIGTSNPWSFKLFKLHNLKYIQGKLSNSKQFFILHIHNNSS